MTAVRPNAKPGAMWWRHLSLWLLGLFRAWVTWRCDAGAARLFFSSRWEASRLRVIYFAGTCFLPGLAIHLRCSVSSRTSDRGFFIFCHVSLNRQVRMSHAPRATMERGSSLPPEL